jgi:DNA (cytosine-5)-methyltransferase 1
MERANVDTTETITHVGLCAGYGGIELGLKRVLPALRSVALCEIEAFAIANLVSKMESGFMDPVPIWTDLKTFPWESFRDRVDILTGGYPCQPFSAAGKRAGKDDPRHLWPWIADGIAAMRPKLCFFENVEGHISLGLSDVIEDLAGMGYRTTWGIFSAAECGAPHQRKRVFILANCISTRLEGLEWNGADWTQPRRIATQQDGSTSKSRICDLWPARPGQPQYAWEPPRVVENSKFIGRSRRHYGDETRMCGKVQTTGSCGGMGNAAEQGLERGKQSKAARVATNSTSAASGYGQTQPTVGGDVDGITDRLDDAELYVTCDNRTDELRLLGNGVVPATAALAFITLLNEQRNPRHLA